MTSPSKNERKQIASDLDQLAIRIEQLSDVLTERQAQNTLKELEARVSELLRAVRSLDPVQDPSYTLDPSSPDIAARLIALALVTQPKVPLQNIAKFYGSGVYALYYHGENPAYSPLSSSETPIYAGKADPANPEATSPKEQGSRLYGRLKDHLSTISKVEKYFLNQNLPNPLHVSDFTCRFLIVSSNAQFAAEEYIKSYFKPIWNTETNICWGMSKHGDSAETRKNDRSPWHVLHPGIPWALDQKLKDKKSRESILLEIAKHFKNFPPFKDREEIIENILGSFVQTTLS